jgi:PleD family two-component response regulator
MAVIGADVPASSAQIKEAAAAALGEAKATGRNRCVILPVT